MQVDWDKVKSAIERAMNSATKGERGGLRIHCDSAERMLKGVKTDVGKEVASCVHHAKSSLDLDRAQEHLKKAQELSVQV